jgi:hypothetical protein
MSSCNYSPCGWDDDLSSLSAVPIDQTLVGIYKPDEITTMIPGYKEVAAQITLEKGGILKIQNIPGSTLDSERNYSNKHEPISVYGKWTVEKKEKQIELSVSLNFEPNTSGSHGTSFRLYRKKGKHVIFIIVGDPDECAAARFIQQ